MRLKAQFIPSSEGHQLTDCVVEQVVEIDKSLSARFRENLSSPYFFIYKHVGCLWTDNDVVHGLLVLFDDEPDGILIQRGGRDTAAATAYIPGARAMVEDHMIHVAKSVMDRAMAHTGSDKVPIDWRDIEATARPAIYDSEYLEPLFKKVLKAHPMAESVDFSDDTIWVTPGVNTSMHPAPHLDAYTKQPTFRDISLLSPASFYLNVYPELDAFTPAQIPAFDFCTLTAEGREDWADVVSAQVHHIGHGEVVDGVTGLNIILKGVGYHRVMDFGNLLAGNCTQEQQALWVENPAVPANGFDWSDYDEVEPSPEIYL